MSLIEILILAVGLSMDAFAAAIACGLTIKRPQNSQALHVATFFGVFQAGMPLLGWALANGLSQWVADIDHWIAFGLLVFIGLKMMLEGFKADAEQIKRNPLLLGALLGLSIATSIDALAAGISFSLLAVSIWMPALIIGCVTFSLSFLGVKIGGKFDHHLENKAKIAGGIILIGIGVKILTQHLIV